MQEFDVITKQMINKIVDTDLAENIKDEITIKDRLIIESVKKLNNPFAMIGVKEVMKDLNICKVVAYKVFQRDDFPALRIGKANQIMLVAYLIWKMDRRL